MDWEVCGQWLDDPVGQNHSLFDNGKKNNNGNKKQNSSDQCCLDQPWYALCSHRLGTPSMDLVAPLDLRGNPLAFKDFRLRPVGTNVEREIGVFGRGQPV